MRVELEGHSIDLGRPDKWVWYDERYTILDLMRYYVAVSPWLLPHLRQRPIVYEVYPGTIRGPHSFEQDPPPRTPRWVKRVRIRGHERTVTYVLVDSAATLAYLVSLFMVTLHIWEATTVSIEQPDFLLFDLDPADGVPGSAVCRAAVRTREALGDLGLPHALVKTSGARGLHVVVPLQPEHEFKTVRTFTEKVARSLAARYPAEMTSERGPHRRPSGTVYVDWGQMGRGMTIVPPYVPRACAGAPVSMPISWEDVERCSRSRSRKEFTEIASRFTIGNTVQALKERGDPWQAFTPVSLRPALAQLDLEDGSTTGTARRRVVRLGQ